MKCWKKDPHTMELLKPLRYPNYGRNWAIATSRSADRAGFNLGFSLARICTSTSQHAAAANLVSHILRLAVNECGVHQEGSVLKSLQAKRLFQPSREWNPFSITKASLVVLTVPASMSKKTATLPRTKEWKPQRYNKSVSP